MKNFYVKEIAIAIFILLNGLELVDRIQSLGISVVLAAYLILYLFILTGFISAAYIKNTVLRYVFAVVFATSSVSTLSFAGITSDFLDYNSFITMFSTLEFAQDAAVQFQFQFIAAFIISAFLFFGIILKPRKLGIIKDAYKVGTTITVYLTVTLFILLRGGDGLRGQLPHIVVPVYSLLVVYEFSTNIVGAKENVKIARNDSGSLNDIIYIIDESISPSYLDINVSGEVDTGLSKKYDEFEIYNYGFAAAVTNCSYSSNLTLRYGGNRDDYWTKINTQPSIFEYAKNAGMRTVYMDAQRTNGNLQNGMDVAELSFVDQFMQFEDVSVMNRDVEISKRLVDFIENDTVDFILVNKMGGHFPVHDKFPDEYTIHTPILDRGNYTDVSDTGDREGITGDQEFWTVYKNSYRNTLLWSVGKFFEQMFQASQLSKVSIIYTSDHGQNFYSDGSIGVNTHCSADPNPNEAVVPLVVIKGQDVNGPDFAENLAINKNKSSHYNIFPTLLRLMNYDQSIVTSLYGEGLHQETNDEFTVNTNFHARLGKQPEWKFIDLVKVDGFTVEANED